MKALVTGATGFIGSHLVEELIEAGFEIKALVRASSKTDLLRKKGVECVVGDLGDFESLKAACQGVDFIFHLAGSTAANRAREFFQVNSEGSSRIAKAAALNPGLKAFIFVSSQAAGGPSKTFEARTENDPDEPVSNYGQSKLLAEKEILKHQERLPLCILRPPIVYGPRDAAIFKVVQMAAAPLSFIPKGSNPEGRKYYSNIYVKDLCKGMLQVAQAQDRDQLYYLCSDQALGFDEMMTIIQQALHSKSLNISVPSRYLKYLKPFGSLLQSVGLGKNFNPDKINELEPDYWLCSNKKAKKDFNFQSNYEFAEAMPATIDWYRENHWLRAS